MCVCVCVLWSLSGAVLYFSAFMAPEVITRNDAEGHGRAADIWSLGCVVLEMITGKVHLLDIYLPLLHHLNSPQNTFSLCFDIMSLNLS